MLNQQFFINNSNGESKIWYYHYNTKSNTVISSWGSIGGKEKHKVRLFTSFAQAQRFINNKINEKLRKGYKLAHKDQYDKLLSTFISQIGQTIKYKQLNLFNYEQEIKKD